MLHTKGRISQTDSETCDALFGNQRLYCHHPFGMVIEERSSSSSVYSFGFNGMEKIDKISGSGNSFDFGARIYSSRLGKWLSTDPAQATTPYNSTYSAFHNSPVYFIDPDGEKFVNPFTVMREKAESKLKTAKDDLASFRSENDNIKSPTLLRIILSKRHRTYHKLLKLETKTRKELSEARYYETCVSNLIYTLEMIAPDVYELFETYTNAEGHEVEFEVELKDVYAFYMDGEWRNAYSEVAAAALPTRMRIFSEQKITLGSAGVAIQLLGNELGDYKYVMDLKNKEDIKYWSEHKGLDDGTQPWSLFSDQYEEELFERYRAYLNENGIGNESLDDFGSLKRASNDTTESDNE